MSERMALRGTTKPGVLHAMVTSTFAVWSDEHDSWLTSGGFGDDGVALRVAVQVFYNDAAVVTIFW